MNFLILGSIICVQWEPSGSMLASASADRSVKLLDFKNGKILYTGNTNDDCNYYRFSNVIILV